MVTFIGLNSPEYWAGIVIGAVLTPLVNILLTPVYQRFLSDAQFRKAALTAMLTVGIGIGIGYMLFGVNGAQEEARTQATAATGSASGQEPGPLPMTPTVTPKPTSTLTPTLPPKPAPTPAPTATPEPSPTPAPTATPEPTPYPTPSPTPVPLKADLWVDIYHGNRSDGSLRMKVYSGLDSTPNSLNVVVDGKKCHNPDFVLAGMEGFAELRIRLRGCCADRRRVGNASSTHVLELRTRPYRK